VIIDELFSEEYLHHPSLPGRTSGPEHARRNLSSMRETSPDIWVSLESMVAEGDMVAIRVTLSATHRPPPATTLRGR
jgi:hypothetical protein